MSACSLPVDTAQLATSRQRPVLRLGGQHSGPSSDALISEVPVALVYNGISHAVLLASPQDLDDFALGFSLSEGILQHPRELYDCDIVTTPAGVEIRLDIASARFDALKARRRTLAGRTGCGLCGVDSLEAVRQTLPPVGVRPTLRQAAIARAVADLPHHQPLHAETGAAHGAAFCAADGRLLLVREDVGRHNALDKLIGALHHHAIAREQGFVLVSSRASYEMVQKTLMARIPALVAVSAPTAYAVELAEENGLLLAGFARPGRLVVYSQPERLYTL